SHPSDVPCAGASNAATPKPAAVSAGTKRLKRPACPPHPCTRSTRGPDPHCQTAMRPWEPLTKEIVPPASTRRSPGLGRVRGGRKNAIVAHLALTPWESRPITEKTFRAARTSFVTPILIASFGPRARILERTLQAANSGRRSCLEES